ncbi:hypothetical protein FNH09_34475 [Streptomyces adustus]|uniref:Sensor domain-containing protein n=1 Tax=Streptomyces adustus TaxID=1609272 RepID=A0A5N8VLK4_9ACTN|nr:hypothetical protein [Streptomyces adustus]MPY36147.1 hypothetical protein [Streptomyces adustus]
MTRARTLLASGLSATTLLIASGCLSADEGAPHAPIVPASSAAATAPSAHAPSTTTALTDDQARAALITDTDLGGPWVPTQGAATWRDGLLKAKTPAGQCQRLLDALYADELLGAPARAVTGLDDSDTGAQLRYQVSGQPAKAVDGVLAWLKTLPQVCARFTATTTTGAVQDVYVTDAPLPEAGDARQGLHVTLTAVTGPKGQPLDGDPATLSLDVAGVRVGGDAFAFTNGGMGDVPNDATQAAVQLGVRRLADVRRQGRAQV